LPLSSLPIKTLLADLENMSSFEYRQEIPASKIHKSAFAPTEISGTAMPKSFLGPTVSLWISTGNSILSLRYVKHAERQVSRPVEPGAA